MSKLNIEKIDCSVEVLETVMAIQEALKSTLEFIELLQDGKQVCAKEALEEINTLPDNLFKKYLESIISNFHNTKKHIWLDDETPIGQIEAKAWALKSKDNMLLYSKILMTMDLNHECTQGEDIAQIVEKWAGHSEVLYIISTYATVPSQWGIDSLCELLEAAEFFENIGSWITLLAETLVNQNSYRSYTGQSRNFDTPIWLPLMLEELQEKLTGKQQRKLDELVREGLNSMKKQNLHLRW